MTEFSFLCELSVHWVHIHPNIFPHVQVFLVWKSSVLQKKVLSFHMDGTPDSSVIHIPVKENQYSMLGRLYHAKP